MTEKDLYGFEIQGLKKAKNVDEKITALEFHKELIKGMARDAVSDIEAKIFQLKEQKNKA